MKDNKIWRVSTGIDRLDKCTEGGFPKNSFTVVTGDIGTGRTIFSYQYLQAGIRNDEKGLLISTTPHINSILQQAKCFRWNFKQMIDEDMLTIHYIDPKTLCEWKAIDEIEHLLQKKQYDRLVLDNLTIIACGPMSPFNIVTLTEWGWKNLPFYDTALKNIARIIGFSDKYEVTTYAVSQKIQGRPGDTFDTISDQLADSLILLTKEVINKECHRYLIVKKLRYTKHDIVQHEFQFTEKGIAFINDRPDVDIFIKNKKIMKDTSDGLLKK